MGPYWKSRLRELGYVEGQNIVIEYRYANGKVEALPGLDSISNGGGDGPVTQRFRPSMRRWPPS
jgi:hypothetical protein